MYFLRYNPGWGFWSCQIQVVILVVRLIQVDLPALDRLYATNAPSRPGGRRFRAAAVAAGMVILMGAPNVVRGGSTFGNVKALELQRPPSGDC